MGGTLQTGLLVGLASLTTSGVVATQFLSYDLVLVSQFLMELATTHPLVIAVALVGMVAVFYSDMKQEQRS